VGTDRQIKATETMEMQLAEIYGRFDAAAAPFKAGAVCRVGCASCCIDVGRVEATTMEGLLIRIHLCSLPKARRASFEKALARDRRRRREGGFLRCPFLQKNDRCAIYAWRPFACRQLYSLRPCTGQGPTVHRRTVELARNAVAELQHIDRNGYSGPLSYILELLDDDSFRRFYLAGGFDPARIMAFARPRGLAINCVDKR
jgi:hypothetical protein